MAGFIVSLLLVQGFQQAAYEFRREYINSVWGERHQGCAVAFDGTVQAFDRSQGIWPVRQVPTSEVERAVALLQGLDVATYRSSQVAYDRGSLIWSVRQGGFELRLFERGDFEGARESERALEIVNLIEEWCHGIESGMPE